MSKRKIEDKDYSINVCENKPKYINYIDTNVSIENLDSFKIFRKELANKVDITKIKYSIIGSFSTDVLEYITIYVFLSLLLFLLFLDFLHDFTNLNRKENQIYSNNKYKHEYKDLLIEIYKKKFEDNLKWINKNIINDISNNNFELVDPLENITLITKDANLKLNDFFDITNLNNEKDIKNKSLQVIEYLGIYNFGQYLPDVKNFKCSENLVLLLNSANLTNYENINFFIDADKSKYTMYPIVNKICELLFDRLSKFKQISAKIKKMVGPSSFFPDNIESITLQSSIVNDYDSATTPQLDKIIKNVKEKYLEYFLNYYSLIENLLNLTYLLLIKLTT